VDATSLNFSYFDRSARSPQNVLNDQWSWSSGFQYQLDFGQARTVQPLGFLPDAPVLSSLGGVEFNYVPTSLSFSGSAERQFNTTRSRPSGRRSGSQPARIANPFRESQNFTHNRSFSLQYDPFGFLGLNFDTNTKQNLNEIASRTQRNLVFSDSSVVGARVLTDVDTAAVFQNPQRFGLPADVSEADLRNALGQTLFIEERLELKSEQELFQDLFFGEASPRTDSYRQRLSSTLRLGILDRKALNWISVQDVSYQSSFQWQNGARESFTGASVQNAVTLRSGVSLHPNKVWERFGFYERLKEAQQSNGEEDEDGASGGRSSGGAARDTTAQAPTNGGGNGENGDTDEDGPGWDDLPLPDPLGILRGVALTFMDIRDFTVNYSGERSAQSSNVGNLQTGPDGMPTGVSTDYSILDAIRGEGPPLRYRLGLSRSIDLDDRIFQQGQVVDNLQNRNRFEARTALSPSSSFNVDLNWNVEWSKQPEIGIQRQTPGAPDGFSPQDSSSSSPFERVRTESGSAGASVWGFGSYQAFFEKQLAKFRNVSPSSPSDPASSLPAAEEVALTKSSVAADFRAAYLTGGGRSIGANGFAPFPMPNWTVRYSGLSDWPFIDAVTESVSLNHGYNAEYETGFNSISTAGDTTSISVAGESISYEESQFEPQSVQIQEQFQPLIGVDVTWPFGLETSVEWNRRNTTALRGTNVVERKTSEISGRISYSKRGMNIPFFARIENRLQVSVTLTRSVNDEREFLLSEALQQAQENPDSFDPSQATEGDNVNPLSQTTLLKIVPEISYNVSNRVTARLLVEFEKFDGDNRRPSFTNVNGSFNLSVSLSEN
jgi:cell surface protein SprA